MTEHRHVAVLDIGKTNVKLALVAADGPAEIALRIAPNPPAMTGPYPHHDVAAIWDFVLDGLSALHREHGIDAISVTTHGATAALVRDDGTLALPVLDYEHGGPDTVRGAYDLVRPSFEETGSPPLPGGLNLGAQLFWQHRTFPDAFAETAAILMYPQFWAYRLSGVAASEMTSLGCHTDLWNPSAADYSSLVDRMGWRRLMAPLRRAHDCLGPVRPDVAAKIGVDPGTPIYCGIHDSNASLLPHLHARPSPFAVVSTGTWVIAMAIGSVIPTLDPLRDTLVNVNAFGAPVPSARFMGGREYAELTGTTGTNWSEADLDAVLDESLMLLPAVQPGSGPFPRRRARWLGGRAPRPGETAVAAAFYLALMSATCLDLIGARGDIVVEGPFAGNPLYLAMLRAATGRPTWSQCGSATGTSIGAMLLAGTRMMTAPQHATTDQQVDDRWRGYAAAWREATQHP